MENEVKLPAFQPDIQWLLDKSKSDWGNPEETRKLLVPYGIRLFDRALYGLDVINGELNVVMAPEKKRKTTFMINIIANVMMNDIPEQKPFIVVDTLESGMPPNRYRDALISNVATRMLLRMGHKIGEKCPVCASPQCQEVGISPEFLRFKSRTNTQQKAIDLAIMEMYTWNLYIYGANPQQGDTRNLGNAIPRWEKLVKDNNMKILVTDHLSQYSFAGIDTSDYEKQIRTVGVMGEFVAKWGVVLFALAQVSLNSQKSAKEGTGKWVAMGGSKAHAEANTIFTTDYEHGSGKMTVAIADSRKANAFGISIPIEDVSGMMYGEPSMMYD